MEQAKDNAYESAQKAKEAAQKDYESAKEGAAGFGERLITVTLIIYIFLSVF
jgi:hypothetical protein